jgi:hypothetical protein
MRLEGLGKLKKKTSSELDPVTFRLVALCLNQLRSRAPLADINYIKTTWYFQPASPMPRHTNKLHRNTFGIWFFAMSDVSLTSHDFCHKCEEFPSPLVTK